jgi:hypothetical protein
MAARAAAWLAILGERDVASIVVPERLARLDEVALRLLLHRAGAHAVHRRRAGEILDEVERSLPTQRRAAFRTHAPACRALEATATP